MSTRKYLVLERRDLVGGGFEIKPESSMTISLSVLYFAGVREVTGVSSELIALSANSTLADLVSKIKVIHPRIFQFNIQVAVNSRIVARNSHLNDGDEIAIFPPVTGG